MQPSTKFPPKSWYALSPLFFLVFGVGGLVWMITTISDVYTGGPRFVGPGACVCELKDSGTFVVWQHISTTFNGRHYYSDGNPPPGLTFEVLDQTTGAKLVVQPDLGGVRPADKDISYSVASFEVSSPGVFRVAAKGAFTERVFSISQPVAKRLIWPVLAGGAMIAMGWVIGPGIALMIFMKRNKKDMDKSAP